MKKQIQILSMVILVFFYAGINFAQSIASVTWNLTTPDSQKVSVTSGSLIGQKEIIGAGPNGMVVASYNSNGQRLNQGSFGWKLETTQDDTRYIQFDVATASTVSFNVTNVSFNYGAAGSTNAMNSNVYYSTDNWVTRTQLNDAGALVYGNSTMAAFTKALNSTASAGQTFSVRIYPYWVSATTSSTSKYAVHNTVVISGTASAVATPASATWVLSSSQSPTTSGMVTAVDQSFSSNLGHYGYNGATGTPPSCDRILPTPVNSGTWTAETSPNFGRYVQYAVSPKPGGTFNVKSVSLQIGCQYSTNLAAGIYYSTDPTFATKTALVADTSLDWTKLVQKNYSVNVTVNDGQTFYVRIFPYDKATEGYAKLICVANVVISGTASGAIASLSTLTTVANSKVGTTFATSGGTITSDGGANVTARGVCWSTSPNPTIAANKTSDGAGSGTFVSSITNLTVNTKYYVRAYATNSTGTAYGNQDSLTTLAQNTVPTVTTTAVSSIAVISAATGGNVTAWGGTEVLEKGVCWNTTGNPTILDNRTSDGSGLGSFTSNIAILQANTKYYVCAYAANTQGIGYGQVVTFTTQTPAAAVTKVVAADGSGNYKTVQEAFDAVPDNYSGAYTIYIKNGIYKEKLSLGKNKTNVTIKGQSKTGTVLTYDDYSGRVVSGVTLGTSTSQSVWIQGNDITIQDITIQNSSHDQGQAVALNVTGDRIALFNCILTGYQDTYYTWNSGRVYHKNCYIEGTVDFIFGSGIAVFDNCTINERRNTGTLTAASTASTLKYGYVFLDCTITADAVGYDGTAISSFLLGRPWQNAPQTVFIRCAEPATLDPLGWTTMQVTPLLYAEYKCTGAGFKPTQRTTLWGNAVRLLTDDEAATYTVANIFSKNSSTPAYGYDWTPPAIVTSVEEGNSTQQIPTNYELFQNYPNPFNPSTTIKYSMPKNGFVKITLYDVLGSQVKVLVNEEKPAGFYEVKFDASNLASGIYFYSIKADDFMQTKKMILMK
jgi:pectin methylesterase-like acyl-CoA thioesterase